MSIGQQRLKNGQVYNPDTDMWTDLPDMKTPRSNHTLAVVQGRLVAVGGYQGTETTSRVEVLDMNTDTWEEEGGLSTTRSALAYAVVNFNSLIEEVGESLRWHMEQPEEEVLVTEEIVSDLTDCVDFNFNSEMEKGASDRIDQLFHNFPPDQVQKTAQLPSITSL